MKIERRLGLSIFFLALFWTCAQKPVALKNPEPLELYQEVSSFYQFLCYKDLDSLADKLEIESRFEDQAHYYFFLDSILPAMRERKFERNRILDFQILGIELSPEEEEAWVEIWILSDDTLPLGKVMKFKQRWYLRYSNWFPSEIKAKKATAWEKYR